MNPHKKFVPYYKDFANPEEVDKFVNSVLSEYGEEVTSFHMDTKYVEGLERPFLTSVIVIVNTYNR